jgi:N-acetylmuramoyl-L-alanine amidase
MKHIVNIQPKVQESKFKISSKFKITNPKLNTFKFNKLGILRFGLWISFGLWILIFGFAGFTFARTKVDILKVETHIMGGYNEVSVLASGNIKPEIILLESPNRVALAFSNARIQAPITLSGPSPLIRMIQAAQFDENTVYVIIEPNETVTYGYTSIIGKNRFILEFSKARPGSGKAVAPSPPTPEIRPVTTPEVFVPEVVIEAPSPAPEVIEKEEKIAPAARPVKPAKGQLPLKGKVIAVNAGHGGRDPGYIGRSGIFEKALNLNIALKLKQFLENAGAKVVMVRTRDKDIKDRDIVRTVNRSKADMFVDVHLNAFTSPIIRGCETFYYTPQSRKFAQTMQKYLYRTIRTKDKGVRKERYYTVHHAKIPAVLVESAYLTNPNEEKLILTSKFRDLIAQGMCKGITEYVKISSWRRSHR